MFTNFGVQLKIYLIYIQMIVLLSSFPCKIQNRENSNEGWIEEKLDSAPYLRFTKARF